MRKIFAVGCAPVLFALALCACSKRYGGPQVPPAPAEPAAPARPVAAPAAPGAGEECRRAGGKPRTIKECDGSESLWCDISAREGCYADQVRDGRCTAGEYSEELKGIVGITPRVICDRGQ